jgi:hypothetical protein
VYILKLAQAEKNFEDEIFFEQGWKIYERGWNILWARMKYFMSECKIFIIKDEIFYEQKQNIYNQRWNILWARMKYFMSKNKYL